MSSLVVDTKTLALEALGDLETADQIAPAVELLRGAPGPAATSDSGRPTSLAARMVAK
ncbi:MAG: hypothetical protein ACRDY3_00380 [Acidimicrobiales bacterium]